MRVCEKTSNFFITQCGAHNLSKRVKEVGFYSIIVDKSKDTSKQEQMSFAVCYVDMADGYVHEMQQVYPLTSSSLFLPMILTLIAKGMMG